MYEIKHFELWIKQRFDKNDFPRSFVFGLSGQEKRKWNRLSSSSICQFFITFILKKGKTN